MEEPIERSVERTATTPARGIHRLKPRAAAHVQMWLAAALCALAAIILAYRGVGWVMDSAFGVWLVLLGAVLGSLKYRYILAPTAARAVERMRRRGTEQCAGGFLSWQSWLLVVVMMAGGHALRLTATPRPVLGVIYVTIAVGLSLGALAYARAAVSPRC